LMLSSAASDTFLRAGMLPPADTAAQSLDEGARAADDTEIVLDRNAADTLDVGLGDTVTLPADFSPDAEEHSLTVVGIAPAPEGTAAAAVAESAGGDDVTVRTTEEAEQQAADDFMQGFGALGMMLAVFVVIALFTSAVVIANTFSVTIAQRTRSLALLRTLGA